MSGVMYGRVCPSIEKIYLKLIKVAAEGRPGDGDYRDPKKVSLKLHFIFYIN